MRWSKPAGAAGEIIRSALRVLPLSLLLLASVFLLRGAPTEKRITVYSKSANYSLPVIEHGQDYVGLFEILEPLGTVRIKSDVTKWKLRYNDVDSEFVNGRKRARVKGRELDLPANFLLEDGRGLVPLASLSTLLPQFLGGPVTFHETSRRLFVGDVAVHFTAQVNKSSTPPVLVMTFTSPVNPSISTEPGKLRMMFNHEALVAPGSQTLTFDSGATPSASYAENNGAAQIDINGTVPLFASFSNDGKTITISAASQAAAQNPAAQTPAAPAAVATGGEEAPASAPGGRRYFAVVDASHGGEERGAALSDQLAEKDVTLALARRLRQELAARGMTTLLTRDGDFTLTADQRANLANSAHPAIYISLHATSQGGGVRLYTALVPAVGQGRGPFLDWDTAQSSFLGGSQNAAASLQAEFEKRQVPARVLEAPLRPLNNIITAAVAVEMAPSADGVSSLTLPAYQQMVASAIASGVLAARDKLEAGR